MNSKALQSNAALFEPLIPSMNAQFFHFRFEGGRFQAEYFRRTPLPSYPPMRRLQHVAKVLCVDFIQPSQIRFSYPAEHSGVRREERGRCLESGCVRLRCEAPGHDRARNISGTRAS